MRVETGDRLGIGGFIITGNAPKRVIVRAIGPSLARLQMIDYLADPVLELHGPSGFATLTNNNWRDTQEAEISATGIPPTEDAESAIVATLAPGAYTALVSGRNNSSGTSLVEVYDLDQAAASQLGNLSTRAQVNTGDGVVIAGFILGNNNGTDHVIIRGLGPSLSSAGVPNALANPTLELRDSNGALIFSNNNWQDDQSQAAQISAAGLAPTDPREAAISVELPPSAYTVIMAGEGGTTGIGLVEVYHLGGGSIAAVIE